MSKWKHQRNYTRLRDEECMNEHVAAPSNAQRIFHIFARFFFSLVLIVCRQLVVVVRGAGLSCWLLSLNFNRQDWWVSWVGQEDKIATFILRNGLSSLSLAARRLLMQFFSILMLGGREGRAVKMCVYNVLGTLHDGNFMHFNTHKLSCCSIYSNNNLPCFFFWLHHLPLAFSLN